MNWLERLLTWFGLEVREALEATPRFQTQFTAILFLDFDGVLHRGFTGTFSKLPLLLDWLDANPSVGLVLTTSWRLDSTIEVASSYLGAGQCRVLGLTPDLSAQGCNRMDEVQAWLAEARWQGSWAILDDEATLFPKTPYLVVTDKKEGLTLENLEAVLGVLRAFEA